MSAEKETLREFYAAINRNDLQSVSRHLDPGIENQAS